MADTISFAEWLKGQLKERKMSQAELAKKSGLGKSVINKIIHQGIKRPDAFTYVAIADALEVSPETVFRRAGILRSESDLPELDDIRVALLKLSPERRKESVAIIQALVRFEEKLNNPPSSE